MAGPKTDAEEVAVLFPKVTKIPVTTYDDEGNEKEKRTVVVRELPVKRTGVIAQHLLPIWSAVGESQDLDIESLLRDHYGSFVEIVAVATNTDKQFLMDASMSDFIKIVEALWGHNKDVFLKGVWPRVANAIKAQGLGAPGQTPSTPFAVMGTQTQRATPSDNSTPISPLPTEQNGVSGTIS